MFLHYFVSSENGEHRSIYIYTIREENQETKRVLTFDPTSFSNRSQRTIRNRSSPPFRYIAAIRGGTLFHEDTLQLPINERAPVFFKWNASRSHNRADLLKERVWAESSVGVPAHFRSTPDLRNDDKFQISRPRVPILVHLPLYIRSTRAIEGRVRVLHLRFYLKPVETCPPPFSRFFDRFIARFHAQSRGKRNSCLIRELSVQLSGDRSIPLSTDVIRAFERNPDPEVCKTRTRPRAFLISRFKINDWKI